MESEEITEFWKEDGSVSPGEEDLNPPSDAKRSDVASSFELGGKHNFQVGLEELVQNESKPFNLDKNWDDAHSPAEIVPSSVQGEIPSRKDLEYVEVGVQSVLEDDQSQDERVQMQVKSSCGAPYHSNSQIEAEESYSLHSSSYAADVPEGEKPDMEEYPENKMFLPAHQENAYRVPSDRAELPESISEGMERCDGEQQSEGINFSHAPHQHYNGAKNYTMDESSASPAKEGSPSLFLSNRDSPQRVSTLPALPVTVRQKLVSPLGSEDDEQPNHGQRSSVRHDSHELSYSPQSHKNGYPSSSPEKSDLVKGSASLRHLSSEKVTASIRRGSERRYASPLVRERERRDRPSSRSPSRRRDSSSAHARDLRGRPRSRSPYPRSHRRKSPGYSPRRRSPPKHHSHRISPRRRPWSPPRNRSTGLGKPGRHLFVAGFEFLTTERDLERKFSRFGNVLDVRIVRDKRSGDSRGFAFLSMDRDEEADAAIKALDESEWNGRIILVEKSKTSGH